MKKTLKRLVAVVLAVMITLSALSVNVFAAEDKTVYYDIERAVNAFRKLSKDWPSEITVNVAKETIDDLCDVSGFNPWSEFRQQFVTNMSVTPNDMLWLYGVTGSDNPNIEYSEVKSGNDRYYKLTYKCALTKAQVEEIDDAADKLVEELGLDDCLSDFERVKSVYDWFTKEVTYNDDNMIYAQTPYGSLVRHEAVCAGIGLGIEKVLDLAGVECRYVSGFGTKGDDVYHGWNIVKINGKYYGLDATSDLGKDRYDWFLTGSGKFNNSGKNHIGIGIFAGNDFTKKYALASNDFLSPGMAGYSDVSGIGKFASLSVETKGNGDAVLEWKAVKGAKKYTIEYKGEGKSWGTFGETTDTKSSIKISNYSGDTIAWRVRSDNGAVSMALSLNLGKKGKVESSYPDVPYIHYCKSEKKGNAVLRWTPSEDASKYIVYYSKDGGKTYQKLSTTDGKFNLAVEGLTSGKKYRFAVCTVGKNGVTTSLGDTYYAEVTVK